MGPIVTPSYSLKKSGFVRHVPLKPTASIQSTPKGGLLQSRQVAFKRATQRALDPRLDANAVLLDELISVIAAASILPIYFALYWENPGVLTDFLACFKKRSKRQFPIFKRSPRESQGPQKARMWLYFIERQLCRLLNIR